MKVIPYALVPFHASCAGHREDLPHTQVIINEGPGYEAKRRYKIQNTISLVMGGKGGGD